jgi:hypothetical protein
MCNRHKSERTSGPDPETSLVTELFHPQRDDWAKHFAWSVDGSQIAGLTATGRATISLLQMNRPQLIRTRRLWVALGEHPPAFDHQ